MCARTRNMLEYHDWAFEISDELSALCAHYNTIAYNRKSAKTKEAQTT